MASRRYRLVPSLCCTTGNTRNHGDDAGVWAADGGGRGGCTRAVARVVWGKAAADPHSGATPDPPAAAHGWRMAVRCSTCAYLAFSNKRHLSLVPSRLCWTGWNDARCRLARAMCSLFTPREEGQTKHPKLGLAPTLRPLSRTRRCLLKHVDPALGRHMPGFKPAALVGLRAGEHATIICSRCRPEELVTPRILGGCLPATSRRASCRRTHDNAASKHDEHSSGQTRCPSQHRNAPRLPGIVISDMPVVDSNPGLE